VDDDRDFDAEVQGFQPDGSLVVVDGNGTPHELSGKALLWPVATASMSTSCGLEKLSCLFNSCALPPLL
jgi:hypothetical protein